MTMQGAIIAAYALQSTASTQVNNTVKTLHWLSLKQCAFVAEHPQKVTVCKHKVC